MRYVRRFSKFKAVLKAFTWSFISFKNRVKFRDIFSFYGSLDDLSRTIYAPKHMLGKRT